MFQLKLRNCIATLKLQSSCFKKVTQEALQQLHLILHLMSGAMSARRAHTVRRVQCAGERVLVGLLRRKHV